VCLIVLNACGYIMDCMNYVKTSMYRMVTERFENLGSEKVHYKLVSERRFRH
jgi:hypothetical protein